MVKTWAIYKFALFSICLAVIGTLANVANSIETKLSPLGSETTPHQVVENVTGELMKLVDDSKQALDEDPQKYYADVRGIMETAVDFKYIAQNVMGKKYWIEATANQKEQFVEVFTQGLVETYAKGLASFANYEVSVQQPSSDIGDRKRVEVIQKFKGPSSVNRVSYTMGKHKSGNWKLINVVLDGVNLGKTLRAQFAQAVTENQGDLGLAISGWTWKS